MSASEAIAEAVLPGEPRTYDARSQVSCQKAFLLHIAKLAGGFYPVSLLLTLLDSAASAVGRGCEDLYIIPPF